MIFFPALTVYLCATTIQLRLSIFKVNWKYCFASCLSIYCVFKYARGDGLQTAHLRQQVFSSSIYSLQFPIIHPHSSSTLQGTFNFHPLYLSLFFRRFRRVASNCELQYKVSTRWRWVVLVNFVCGNLLRIRF